jgi:hypothetical protein
MCIRAYVCVCVCVYMRIILTLTSTAPTGNWPGLSNSNSAPSASNSAIRKWAGVVELDLARAKPSVKTAVGTGGRQGKDVSKSKRN